MLRPLQIHAQQHLGPVLRFGSAGTGLNLEKCVVRVEFAVEHAAELEVTEFRIHGAEFAFDVVERGGIVFGGGHLEQFAHVAETGTDALQIGDDAFQRGAFLTERLRAIRIVPHVRLLQLEFYLFETAFAFVEVKDTP